MFLPSAESSLFDNLMLDFTTLKGRSNLYSCWGPLRGWEAFNIYYCIALKSGSGLVKERALWVLLIYFQIYKQVTINNAT